MSLGYQLERLGSRLRVVRLRWQRIDLGPACRVARGARLALTWLNAGHGRIALGPACDVRHGAVLESWGGHIVAGRNVFIGPHAVLYGHGGIDIGNDVLISMHVCVLSSNHAIPAQGNNIRGEPDVLRPVRIGNDVWLGAGAIVLGGVSIGNGCVIGAGAVVTKDIPNGAIAVGVPAEIKGYRVGASAPT